MSSAFPLNQLGWDAFQRLCGAILSEVLGQTYEIYSPTSDRGRDGGFQGTWSSGSEAFSGRFTIQCKHVAGERRTIRKSDLKDEVAKVRVLAGQGLADVYIVLTNCRVTVPIARTIEAMFVKAGAKYARTYGAEWIEEKIRESGRLRALVPRVYGLGDLSEILDERVYQQSRLLLRSMQNDLSKFVPTRAYHQAVDAVDEHGFALLIGEPAAGKTAIAHMLSLMASDRWQSRVMSIENVRDLRASWNPDANDQLFILDDAFGSTQYQRDKSEAWNQTTQLMSAAIKEGVRFVVTSRNYVYEHARRDLKEGAFPILQEGQVVVDVEDLTDSERQQILYNHIKLGNQPKEFKATIKPWLLPVSAHPRFQPEIARRLGTSEFTKSLQLNQTSVLRFVSEPREFLKETIRALSTEDRAALIFLFMHGGTIPSPVRVGKGDAGLERLGIQQSSLVEALQSLRGSFVSLNETADSREWAYRHPTIRDALSEMVRDDAELHDIYLAGVLLPALLTEVTCGVSDVRGVSINIPRSLYADVIARLQHAMRTKDHARSGAFWRSDTVYNFLSYRCSREFLSQFLDAEPAFLDEICEVGSYLDSVAEPSVVAAFAGQGLLDTNHRQMFINNLKTLAVETPDAGWLSVSSIRTMLTDAERESILEYVEQHFVTGLEHNVYDAVHNVVVDGPDEFISTCETVQEQLSAYVAAFDEASKPQLSEALTRQIQRIDEWVADAEAEREPRPERAARQSTAGADDTFAAGGASIFDDIEL